MGSLFGVSKGAFTGVVPRTGALDESDGGTLFIDEVHALPLRVQRSLLRFVEDGLLHLLGQRSAGKRAKSNVQVIFGTNLDVEQACAQSLLAHDLVARLHPVTIPPLRERRADIPSIFTALVESRLAPEPAAALLARLDVHIVERLCCPSLDLQPGESMSLPPGAYGAVSVKTGASLTLADGEYVLDSLSIEPNAEVILDNLNGAIHLKIRTSFHYKSELIDTAGYFDTVVEYGGDQDVAMLAPFFGTYIAPDAALYVGTSGALEFIGAFYAQRIEVHPDAVVTHAPIGHAE